MEAFFEPGRIGGHAYAQFAAAAATYTLGKLAKKPRVVHIGVDLIRTHIVAYALTFALKSAVRRGRPDHSNHRSFPSGHASATFATATVLQRHFGWRGAIAYPLASYVAASRLHENRHFLSDVVFGATLGLVAGRTVTRRGRNNWRGTIVPTRGGVMLALVKGGN